MFHEAACLVRERFYRRFPHAPRERWDLTNIKSRWYNKGLSHIKRQFGFNNSGVHHVCVPFPG